MRDSSTNTLPLLNRVNSPNGGGTDAPYPTRCQKAKDYLCASAPAVLFLMARMINIGQDPKHAFSEEHYWETGFALLSIVTFGLKPAFTGQRKILFETLAEIEFAIALASQLAHDVAGTFCMQLAVVANLIKLAGPKSCHKLAHDAGSAAFALFMVAVFDHLSALKPSQIGSHASDALIIFALIKVLSDRTLTDVQQSSDRWQNATKTMTGTMSSMQQRLETLELITGSISDTMAKIAKVQQNTIKHQQPLIEHQQPLIEHQQLLIEHQQLLTKILKNRRLKHTNGSLARGGLGTNAQTEEREYNGNSLPRASQ